jgi:predicted ATPase
VARIQTPDQRVRVFISSTMKELAAERAAVREAVERLHLTPILFELGARPHPPKELYLAYLRQSHVFLGIYWEQYGWIAPGESVSGLEDEYLASGDKPRLIYVKSPAPGRHPRLAEMLERIANEGLSYRRFGTPEELAALVEDDLAVLLSERFGPPGPAEDFPVAVPARRSRHLPAPTNRFIGREPELAELRRLLTSEDVRLVTLVGPGGIGKTRLALAAADGLSERFPDGVLPVMLAAVREPEAVPAAIAAELGLPDTFGRSPEEAVVEALRARRMLLLLDNMEQVVEAAPLIARVLAEAEDLRVLVTSREVLHLTGEHVLAVPPLPVGDPGDAVGCRRSEAVELFLDRARAAGAQLESDDRRVCLVAEICRRLEGLPLAIELAAARVRTLDPEVILRRLDHRLVLLTGGPRDAAARQRALRATIQWSYDLLDDDQRHLFARLGIFSGGFFLDAVEAVCGADERRADVLEGLMSLADKSMIRAGHPVDGVPSFSMLETVREFALEMLDASGEKETVARLHAEYFEQMARTSVMGIHNGPDARSWECFATEAANIRAALGWYRDTGQPDRIAAMGEGMWPIWWGWSVFDEGIAWMQAALADPGVSTEGRALAEFVRGSLAFGHGDPMTSAQALQEARRLHRESGDDVRAATDAILLGIALSVGDPETGERLEREAVDVLRRQGTPWKLAFALFALGRVLVVTGRTEEAVPLLEESVRLQRYGEPGGPSGPHPLLGYALVNLGWARLDLDDADAAGRTFRKALAAAREADQQVRARALEGLAAVALHQGDPRTGGLLFGGAEAVRRAVGVGVWLTDRSTHADTEGKLRAALGPSAYETAFDAGLRSPPDDLYGLACAPVSPATPATATPQRRRR